MPDTPNGFTAGEASEFNALTGRNWTAADEKHAYDLAVAEASGTLTGEITRYLLREG